MGIKLVQAPVQTGGSRYAIITGFGFIEHQSSNALFPTLFLSEYTQVVLNILMTRGILEQRACLDTLLALLVDCSENLTVIKICSSNMEPF